MTGAYVGSLNVKIIYHGIVSTIWSMSGDQNATWHKAEFKIMQVRIIPFHKYLLSIISAALNTSQKDHYFTFSSPFLKESGPKVLSFSWNLAIR